MHEPVHEPACPSGARGLCDDVPTLRIEALSSVAPPYQIGSSSDNNAPIGVAS